MVRGNYENEDTFGRDETAGLFVEPTVSDRRLVMSRRCLCCNSGGFKLGWWALTG